MPNSLTTARHGLAEALRSPEGPVVHDTVPDAVEPPCLIVQAAEGVIALGDTFADEYDLTYEVWLCVEYLSNAQATEALEDLLATTVPRVAAAGWALDRVDQPGPMHTADWLAHGQRLLVSTTIPA